jgi:hypothetical protein
MGPPSVDRHGNFEKSVPTEILLAITVLVVYLRVMNIYKRWIRRNNRHGTGGYNMFYRQNEAVSIFMMECINPMPHGKGVWKESKEVRFDGTIRSRKKIRLLPTTEAEMMLELI